MNALRFRCAALLGWFFLLYNIERLHKPINLASFVYVLVAVVAVLVLVAPSVRKLSVTWLLLGTILVILIGKLWKGIELAGPNLPITVTEIATVWLTIALTRGIRRALDEMRDSVGYALTAHMPDRTVPFSAGQGEIYREMRRARLYERPLTLLAIAPTDETVSRALDRFTREMLEDLLRAYTSARIAEVLTAETSDCDIITNRDGHFITLLPETSRERAADVVEQLQLAAKQRLGLDLNVGLSVFPDDEVTFVSLLESAEAQMWNSAGVEETAGDAPTLIYRDNREGTPAEDRPEDLLAEILQPDNYRNGQPR